MKSMISKLLTEAVTNKRIFDGVHQILNATGGDSKQFEAGGKFLGLEVAIDLMLGDLSETTLNEVAPYLDEMFYEITAKPENTYKDSGVLAGEIHGKWNTVLSVYAEVA